MLTVVVQPTLTLRIFKDFLRLEIFFPIQSLSRIFKGRGNPAFYNPAHICVELAHKGVGVVLGFINGLRYSRNRKAFRIFYTI